MKTKYLMLCILLLTGAIAFYSCSKDNSGTSNLQVLLTDAPAAYDQVNVEINRVEVKFRDGNTEWVSLNTNVAVYDLLALQNGVTTPLASGTFPTTNIVKEIRLILGSKNTIVEGGVTYPLTIPSGSESGLKIKVDKKLNETLETLVIDFDAALSIKSEAGGYKLRPVLKIK